MDKRTYVVPLQNMMDDLFTCDAMDSKTFSNIFTNVPKFSSERDMYDCIIERLNGYVDLSRNGVTFPSGPGDSDQQDIVCGMYASGSVVKDGHPAKPRCSIWTLIELLIACKLDSVSEDPFGDSSKDGETAACKRREVFDEVLSHVELVFKYQQRQFVYTVLFLGDFARVLRFDRSGIITSEKVDYKRDGAELTEFLVRYACLAPTNRGHDPSAVRISPTDALRGHLKRHGVDAAEKDPEDHVQKLFNQSLDEKWPWWKLCVRDEESEVERWFAVGKPHFYAGGVASRGTRGYVAVPLDDDGAAVDSTGKFVYLKDAWRVDREGMKKEGVILKALNAAKVPYIPTLLYHGDLDQSTKSYDMWPDYHEGKTREECPLKSHLHYRLVVAEVGKPLSEFENAFELVWALFCCITAHEQACAAGYIHRDISAGNVLLYKDGVGDWVGLLNDWELSGECVDGKTQSSGHLQLDRAGTWQFMSAHVLLKRTKLTEIPDDLESFIHVLLYFAVRFLPHSLTDERLVARFLYYYFDDYTDGNSGFNCGLLKYSIIKRGVLDLAHITGSGGGTKSEEQPLIFLERQQSGDSLAAKTHPINGLITDLFKALQAFYAKDAVNVPEQAAYDDPFRSSSGILAALEKAKTRDAGTFDTKSTSAQHGRPVDPTMAATIESHAALQKLVAGHLTDSAWPKLDKGDDKKPKDGYVPAKEDTVVGSTIPESTIPTASKRGAEDGGEQKSKRVRSRAA